MIVQYYADSLGLSRPGAVTLGERYIYLFEQWLKQKHPDKDIFVINRARRALTVNKLLEVYKEDNEYLPEKKDILIIHEGVCDCAPRPIPMWFRRMVSVMPGFIKYRIISFLHKRRATLLKRGFRSFLVKKDRFEVLWREWLTDASGSYKQVYVFNIAPTNDAIEKHSPGFRKSIHEYNAILEKVCREFPDGNIRLIDVHQAILGSGLPLNDLVIEEDGHHITARAHRLYAELLMDAVNTGNKAC
jgi:hypothetical protein